MSLFRTIRIGFIALGSFFSLSAQTDAPSIVAPSLHLGGSLGMTLSQVAFMPNVLQGICLGPTVGVSASVENSPYTAISLELNYALRGWTEHFSESRSGIAYTRRLHMIEMPLLCQLFYPIGKVRLGIKAGPKIGYMLGEKSYTKGDTFTTSERQRHSLSVAHRFAWGVTGGPLVALTIGRQRIELEGRFYYGFNDIFNTTVSDPYSKASEMAGVAKVTYLFRVL